MEDRDGFRIATSFTADTAVEVRIGFLTFLDGESDESLDCIGIDGLERIEVDEVVVEVLVDEGGVIVSREAVGELSEVVSSIGEVSSLFSDFTAS